MVVCVYNAVQLWCDRMWNDCGSRRCRLMPSCGRCRQCPALCTCRSLTATTDGRSSLWLPSRTFTIDEACSCSPGGVRMGSIHFQARLCTRRPNLTVVMVALCNRADHYIFILCFLSFYLFSSRNLSRRRLDVCHTSTHGVALVRI